MKRDRALEKLYSVVLQSMQVLCLACWFSWGNPHISHHGLLMGWYFFCRACKQNHFRYLQGLSDISDTFQRTTIDQTV